MSRTRSVARGVAFAVLVWCAACGDESSGSGSTGPGGAGAPGNGGPDMSTGGNVPVAPEVEAYFAEFTSLLCGGLSGCCGAEGLEFSEEGCRAIFDGIGAAFAELEYDPAAGERCLEELRSRAGDCSPKADPFCSDVFRGTAELGAACRQAADCALVDGGEVDCAVSGPELQQRCLLRVRAGAGEPCAETCFEGAGVTTCSHTSPASEDHEPVRGQCYLNDGVRCDPDTLTCSAPLDPGTDCAYAEECGAFATCREGSCSDGAAEGEECFELSECASGLVCGGSGVCGPAELESLARVCSTFSGT